MKKLLLLAGILVVGATSFAHMPIWPGYQDGKSYDTLKVSAEVVRDLKVKATDVEFGRVAAGQTLAQPKKAGSLTIIGAKGANVNIALYQGHREIKDGETVALYRNGERSFNTRPLIYKPDLGDTHVKLNRGHEKVGEYNADIKGTLHVPVGTPAGNYSTDLVVKAQYDMFADE